MYIELWNGLRDLYHDNDQTESQDNAKRFINWAIKDIANEYDWEFLRGEKTFTCSADGTYELNPFTQLDASASTIRCVANASADDGTVVKVNGKRISSTGILYIQSEQVTVSASLSASAGNSFAHIDAFTKPITTDSVVVTSDGSVLSTLGASDTYIANDVRKINVLIDQTNNATIPMIDISTQLKNAPDEVVRNSYAIYDIASGSQVKMLNVDSASTYKAIYQKLPKYLINNNDRTEFPYELYQDIINYAYEVYGLRFQDEADAWNGKQRQQFLIQEMIKKWTMGKDTKTKRVMPKWIGRRY